jgi:hypothetical protein
MTFAQRLRMVWIDAMLWRRGNVNRCDICEAFGVSMRQAANDFRAFRSEWPAAMTYNRYTKTYERVAPEPVFRQDQHQAALDAAALV